MTILFYSDWQSKGARPDWTTPNKSALHTATVYKRMGIQNHAFHLALYDQDLKGVDPFDENLTPEMQAKITREFGCNLWYAIRECIRIPPVAGIDPIPYKFHRANIALYWLYMNNLFSINVIARQRGKTMAVICLFVWLLEVTHNTTISSISKDDDLRGSIIRTFKKVYECLPPFLQFRDKTDSRNNQEFTVNTFKNIFKMAVPSSSAKRAYLIGRGLTTSTTWSEECCFSPNIRISLGACIASGTAAREEAQLKGQPNGVILTTTAGLIDDRDAGYIYELAMDSTLFNERFYDIPDKMALYKLIRANNASRVLRVYATFNHLQLGISHGRQLGAIQMAAQSVSDTERDFLSIWNRGGVGHPLPAHILSKINGGQIEPVHVDIDQATSFVVNWYINERFISNVLSTPTVLSLDPSELVGLDGMSLVLQLPESGAVIATANQALASIPAYIRWLYMTFIKPYPALVMVIENRSTGQSIIDGLIELLIADGENPFLRIFNTVVHDIESDPDKWELVRPPRFRPAENQHIRLKKHFGFKTAGAGEMARSILYGQVFFSACSECGPMIRDHMIISQIAGLIEKDGKINHAAGGHDDLVVAWLLGQWFIRMGRNLSIYGINSQSILQHTKVIEATTVVDKISQRNLKQYRELLEVLSNTNEIQMQQRLIQRIRGMELEIDISSEAITLTQVVDDIKRKRKQQLQAEGSSARRLNSMFGTLKVN